MRHLIENLNLMDVEHPAPVLGGIRNIIFQDTAAYADITVEDTMHGLDTRDKLNELTDDEYFELTDDEYFELTGECIGN